MTQPTDPTGSTRPSAPAPRTEPTRPAEPIDDLVLAGLVRDVAEGWHLPPRRLDEPTWTDRVDPRRVGRRLLGGRLGRLAGRGGVAVGATLVLSLVAVWLGQPRGRAGRGGASPSGVAGASGSPRTATPGPTVRPTSTPLPELLVHGDLPTATSVLVRSGPGHAVVDLVDRQARRTGQPGDRRRDARPAGRRHVRLPVRGRGRVCPVGLHPRGDPLPDLRSHSASRSRRPPSASTPGSRTRDRRACRTSRPTSTR